MTQTDLEEDTSRRGNTVVQTSDEDELLTAKEVAKHLRVTEGTVRRWIRQKKIETVSLPGGGYRIKKSVVDAILHPKHKEE